MLRILLFICLAHVAVSKTISGRILLSGSSTAAAASLTGCQISVQVIETAMADTAALVLGNAQYSNVASFPVSFQVTFTLGTAPMHSEALVARITCSNGRLYLNDYRVNIAATDEDANGVDIYVKNVGPSA